MSSKKTGNANGASAAGKKEKWTVEERLTLAMIVIHKDNPELAIRDWGKIAADASAFFQKDVTVAAAKQFWARIRDDWRKDAPDVVLATDPAAGAAGAPATPSKKAKGTASGKRKRAAATNNDSDDNDDDMPAAIPTKKTRKATAKKVIKKEDSEEDKEVKTVEENAAEEDGEA
ncbi:hypothetical protein F5Y18DRAFT_355826 [Xylariaceae sp. FL1019]|nr:hypothetical protein F5Y18DRAFT_355826 [Xylariaceae sp. FL1019]